MASFIFTTIDFAAFILFAFILIYLFVFALFSKGTRKRIYPVSEKKSRIAVLFPAYKEDNVILSSVTSFFDQDYPREKYDVIVLSDHMQSTTNQSLEKLTAKVLEIKFEESSKAKALNFAIDELDPLAYDIVVIMDADNLANNDFLTKINDVYVSGVKAIQAHRTAKNMNTETALLDAASEEINNSIFRKGQVNVGFSAALSGSGMAFDYKWFVANIKSVSSSGEDKEIEALLLKQKIFIEYLDEVHVLDEKIQNSNSFYNQRRRWIAAQYAIFMKSVKNLPNAIRDLNFDYCNKIFQWIIPPRVLLLGGLGIFTLSTTFIHYPSSYKWWGLLFMLLLTFFVSIPNKLLNKRLLKALIKVPWLFILMFLNLFRLKGANQKFNRTEHTN